MLVAGWVFVCALAGCSSSDETESVPVEQFPQKFASELCAAIAPCCMDAALTHVPATCRSNATDLFTQWVVNTNGRKVKYDASAAGECLSQIKSAYASCQMPTVVTAPACGKMFAGTV